MKLESNEVLLFEEDIHPQARAEVDAITKELESLKQRSDLLISEAKYLKAKADHIAKTKWAVFDRYHPRTSPSNYPDTDEKAYCRRHDRETNKVGVVEVAVKRPSGESVTALKAFLTSLTETEGRDAQIEVRVEKEP